MKRDRGCSLLLLCLLLLSLAAPASGVAGGKGAANRASTKLRASVLGAAGRAVQSETLRMNGTLAQPTPVGVASSDSVELTAGYWAARAILTQVPGGEVPAFRDVLFQNVPNPFNPVTTIRFETREGGRARITIYDIAGRAVRHLAEQNAAPGAYEAAWDGRDDAGRSVASGIYLYRLEVGGFSDVKKMALIR